MTMSLVRMLEKNDRIKNAKGAVRGENAPAKLKVPIMTWKEEDTIVTNVVLK
jgi:hypothetical protein